MFYQRIKLVDRLDVANARELTYSNEVAERGTLISPDTSPRFLQARPRLERRTDLMAEMHRNDLQLFGFRSYHAKDEGFFVDGELNTAGATRAFAAADPGTGKYEDADLFFKFDDAFVGQRSNDIVIDEDVISVVSAEPSNYGSWLYRILPKIDAIDADDDRPILVYHNTEWQLKLLNLFAPGRRIIRHWTHHHYVLRNATVISPKNIGVYFDQRSLDFYRNAPSSRLAASGHDRIYIKRGATRIRPIVNEDELIARLSSGGFFIVDPATMTITEQIDMYRTARIVVCAGGSGLFNLVFAENAEFVVDIEPSRDWLYAHCNVMQSCGIPHTVIFGDKLNQDVIHSPWTIDVGSVEQALEHFGAC